MAAGEEAGKWGRKERCPPTIPAGMAIEPA
jgi:hypothetical protein